MKAFFLSKYLDILVSMLPYLMELRVSKNDIYLRVSVSAYANFLFTPL